MLEKVIILSAGLLPSFIWLLFYLRKDSHPESNKMVLKIFFFGALSGVAAILLEKAFQKGYGSLITTSALVSLTLPFFLAGGLIEEGIKLAAVKIGLWKTQEADEPVDWILYMIISALGFAALENVLVLTSYHEAITSFGALEVMVWRFLSATFLHALCSGALGYFWALSFGKSRKIYFWVSFVAIASLHAFYNWSIMNVTGLNKFLLPLVILISFSLFVSIGIKHLKNLKSTCEIK